MQAKAPPRIADLSIKALAIGFPFLYIKEETCSDLQVREVSNPRYMIY